MTEEETKKEDVKFKSHDEKIEVICDPTTSLGSIHDFLVNLKGRIVDQIIKAQVEDEESNKALLGKKEEKEESVEEPAQV
jgi:hypothetical protein